MTDDQQIAPLRRPIRRTGCRGREHIVRLSEAVAVHRGLLRAATLTRRLRWGIGGCTHLFGAGMLAWGYFAELSWWLDGPVWMPIANPIVWSLTGVTLLLGSAWALPLAAGYRWLHKRELRRMLLVLSPHDAHRVLRAIDAARSPDASKLLDPLLREFSRSTELAPATAPHARGDEPSPAEHAHAARLDE